MKRPLLASFVACVLLADALSGQGPTATPSELHLRPGDVLRVIVWRQPEMSGEFTVGLDSALVHPLYRAVKVAGMPIHDAESNLRKFLTRYSTDPQIVVEPMFRVGISGEVRQPGLQLVSSYATVAQALATAGGPTERAELARVELVRDGHTESFDLRRPESATTQMRLQSGDQIIVGRNRSLLRDVISPAASITSLLASLITLYIRTR
jgi:protein involved in polysaccharide export with SLBB domain